MATKLLDPVTTSSYGNEFAAEDISIEDFVLKIWRKRDIVDLNIVRRITEATVNRTIEGASTVTVTLHDPDQKILNSDALQRTVDVEVDGFWYRLVGLNKNDDFLDLVFEDRDVAYIRSHKKVKHISRAKATRAQFMLSLVRSVKVKRIPVVIPELTKKQPIRGQREGQRSQSDRDRNRDGGIQFDDEIKLTIKGKKVTRGQVKNINRIMGAALAADARPKALVALVVACIGESSFLKRAKNPTSTAEGVFQVLDTTAAALNVDKHDLERLTEIFIKDGFAKWGGANDLAKNNPGMSAGEIASKVEGSDAGGEFYQKHRKEAQAIIDAYGGQTTAASNVIVEPYIFTTRDGDKAQNYWDAMGRLCEEVGWSRFMSNGVLYIVAEADLFRSRARMRFREGAKGIQRVNFNYDVGKAVAQATVICRAERWIAPPGTIVELVECGAASGKWLVSEINRSLFDPQTTITLKKPRPELKEPAPTVTNVSGDSAVTGEARNLKDISLKKEWGGSLSIFEQFVTPFMEKRGITNWTEKRTPEENHATGGSEDSDHLTTNRDAYAIDYATNNGAKKAKALATAMGYQSWQENSYTTFNIKVGNRTFRVQILWGAGIRHGDHIHVGIRRIRPR